MKNKEKNSCHSPSVTHFKDPKLLNNYVDEAMESESYDKGVDEENTVFEEYEPN